MKRSWVIVGPQESWETAFNEGNIWGVKPLVEPEWIALSKGDVLFFYITKTIKGIIGVGRLDTKFIQDRPLWPDEINMGKVIYPFRFEFNPDFVLEQNRWKEDRISQKEVPLSIQEMRRGICLLQNNTVEKLNQIFQDRFNHEIKDLQEIQPPPPSKLTTESTEDRTLDHTKIQELVFQVGKLNRWISEKEYPIENERLDVVWRRVERSVPTYAFEIQVGGDIYHALGKLKHAFDLWNSNIFLVLGEDDFEKTNQLLSGTFHEIAGKLKKIPIPRIKELYLQKQRWIDIEKELGLL